MRKLNLTIGCLILVCSIAVSYSHTVTMFMRAGYDNLYLAHLVTIAAELTFFLGIINIVHSRITKKDTGKPAKFGFWLGVLVIGYSNGSALAGHGPEGIALGLAVPLFLITSEAIISHAIMNQTAKESNIVTEVMQTVSDAMNASDSRPDRTDIVSDDSEKEPDKPDNLSDMPPVLVAERLRAKEGKLPSIRRLSEVAGISRYQAEKTLKQLKAQTG